MKKTIFLNILTAFLLIAFSRFSAAVETPKNPNSAKGCAICHYRWIDTFFIEGKGTDLVEYHSEKVVASPEMCFSCHDGSVKDSRAKLNNGSGHKTNMPPPADMKIPEIFPLDESGKVQCATCHTAHGVPSGTESKETIFMRTSNIDSAMCRMCHPEKQGGLQTGNHPMDSTKQPVAAQLILRGAVFGEKKNQMLCETCHAAHGSPYERFLINSAGDSALCLDCHGDKNIFSANGNKNANHVINVAPQTAKIPQSLIRKGAKLGYRGIITCQTCHMVHNHRSNSPALLVEKNEKSSLCLTCHADKRSLRETKHDLMVSAPQEKNLQGKTAAESGVCSACHLPHKPARKLSGKEDFTTQLCLSCHTKGSIGEKVNFRGNSHPLNVNPFEKRVDQGTFKSTDFNNRSLTLPLFNTFGVPDAKGNMTCSTCHNPHESRVDLVQSTAGDNTAVYFLRRPAHEICAECHSDKISIANSKHDLSKVAPESKNILNQPPLEAGLCGNCHAVHGGQQRFLWARPRTSDDNMGWQALCMDCHSEQGIAKKKAIKNDSHPINISPSEKGLTTTLPLFDKNARISKNGVMMCHTCHDPHRWDPVNTWVGDHYDLEGNSQNSFLRLANSPQAGLCSDCHADKAYVEKTDHDLNVTAPDSLNIIGQTPINSGVCGACHLVHNSKNRAFLWARDFGPGSSLMETLCNSCHSQNGPAKDKVPKIADHPKDKLIINAGRNIKGRFNYFPIFDDITGKLLPVGNISCPSCHNAHQWDSRFKSRGEGVNVEGNTTNSFLRSQALLVLCIDCHGPEALLKIKFFHYPDLRKTKSTQAMLR